MAAEAAREPVRQMGETAMNDAWKMAAAMGCMIRENARMIERMQRMCAPFEGVPAKRPPKRPLPVTGQRKASPDAPGPEAEPAGRPNGQEAPYKADTRASRELNALFDPGRYSAQGISTNDLRYIIGQYGSSVEDIYALTAGQKWMLEEMKRVKSAFFLQILTKAVIPFDLPLFRQRADEVCRKHESLRSAFVSNNLDVPYRVILKDRQPEINCFDLSDLDMEEFEARIPRLMEADRARGFDLERNSLLRINIYKSCKENTYAIVISQPHLNSDGTSLGILFKDLFFGYVLDMNGVDKNIESQSFKRYAEHLNSVDREKELDFWKKTLEGMDEDQLLPGQQTSDLDYDSASLFVPFDDRKLALLREGQKCFRVTQFTLLQGLWGVMAATLKGRRHIVFGAITSGRDADVSDSMALSGGFVNAIPVRIDFEADEPFSAFFPRVQREFLRCMENAHVSPGQIQEALGRGRPVFSHLINNHNFAKPKGAGFAGGNMNGINIIGGDVYDNLSADLCVYFTQVDGRQGCNFSYNARAFSKETIQLIAEFYSAYLDAFMDHGGEGRIGMLPELDTDMILVSQDIKSVSRVKTAGILKKHPVFAGASDDALIGLARMCSLTHYSEDGIVIRKGEYSRAIPLLLEGRCILYGETRDGWNNPLSVLNKGSILDYASLLNEEKTVNTVVSSEKSQVLLIPRAAFLAFLEKHPEAALEVVRLVEKDRRRFMKLWMSDG